MSVPQDQGIQDQLLRGLKNRLLALRLPKLDVESILGIADSAIRFNELCHSRPPPCRTAELGGTDASARTKC
jgi:hypothetical protein